MNYYPEHILVENELSEIYSKVEYIQQEGIQNNRAIYGDEVYLNENQEVVGIPKRSKKKMIGILYLDSTTKYGVQSNTGNMIYLCKSLHPEYGSFYISSSKKEKVKMYVRFEFKEWKRTQRLPHGIILDYIGKVGDEHTEYEMLRYYHDLDVSKWNDLKINRPIHENYEYEIFSIDPIGSKDIDDGFHFRKLEDGQFEIGVHIASPTFFIHEKNDIDRILMERISTVYLPHKNYPMIPKEISEDSASLLEGQIRPTISVIYRFGENGYEGMECKESWVRNRKNMNYEEVDQSIQSCEFGKKNRDLKGLIEFTKRIQQKEELDSHQLVEYWMIFTNQKIAEYGISRYGNQMILRTCPEEVDGWMSQDQRSTFEKYMRRKEMKSAKYQFYRSDQNMRHSILNIDYYTHFTSPIRRCIDFYIHLLLRNQWNESYEIDLERIHDKMKRIRRMERDLQIMRFIFQYPKQEDTILPQEKAYIVDLTDRYIKIYLHQFDIEGKIYYRDRMGYSEHREIEWNEDLKQITRNGREYKISDEIWVRIYIFQKEEFLRNKIRYEWCEL